MVSCKGRLLGNKWNSTSVGNAENKGWEFTRALAVVTGWSGRVRLESLLSARNRAALSKGQIETRGMNREDAQLNT